MIDSVPGADSVQTETLTEGVLTAQQTVRYQQRADASGGAVRRRRPAPGHAVVLLLHRRSRRRPARSCRYSTTRSSTSRSRRASCSAPRRWPRPGAPVLSGSGQRLPHGIGWFVQTAGNDNVVWQFGTGENGSSSMVITLPDARPDAGGRGQQQRPGEDVSADERRRDDLAVWPAVPEHLRSVTVMRRLRRAGFALALLLALAAPARAEWQFRPFVGVDLRGSTTLFGRRPGHGRQQAKLALRCRRRSSRRGFRYRGRLRARARLLPGRRNRDRNSASSVRRP